MRMSLRALLAVSSLTVLGFALGVAGDRLWLALHSRGTPRAQIVLDTEHAERFHAMLAHMELSDSQRVAVDSILDHYQGTVEQTWASMQPRLQTTMDSARQAFEALFDADQLATFQQWLAAEHRRMHGTEHPAFRH
ncbi:MAG TPA: hypothetical protein VGA37_13610 [Gemmatimonadales bacterium]